jgi:hypothetical protein
VFTFATVVGNVIMGLVPVLQYISSYASIYIYIYIYIYAPLSKFLTSILYQQNLQEFSTYLSISSYTHLALLV